MVQINVPYDRIADFCRKWKVSELALFGSVLSLDDFRPNSDVDVLVSFSPDAGWSLFDFVDMQDDLKAIFCREIDMVEKETLRNPFRRKHILEHNEVIYAA